MKSFLTFLQLGSTLRQIEINNLCNSILLPFCFNLKGRSFPLCHIVTLFPLLNRKVFYKYLWQIPTWYLRGRSYTRTSSPFKHLYNLQEIKSLFFPIITSLFSDKTIAKTISFQLLHNLFSK